MIYNLFLFVISFVFIWIFSGLIIKSTESLAKRLHQTSFLVSYFFLGLITSTTEISVAANSYITKNISISIGNLLGGTMVIIFFIIPALGILNNGIKFKARNTTVLNFSVLYLILPLLLIIDGVITRLEGLILFAFYLILIVQVYRRTKIAVAERVVSFEKQHVILILKIIVSFLVIAISSYFLVTSARFISTELGISSLIFSMFALSIGTNIPELTVAARSVLNKKDDVALGDYLGSSVVNVATLAVLMIFSGAYTFKVSVLPVSLFGLFGLTYFMYAVRTNRTLTRFESLGLICVYIVFIVTEYLVNG